MSKLRIVLSLAAASATLALGVLACDDDATGSSFDETADAASADTGTFFNDSSTADTLQSPACAPSLPTTFVAKWTAPTKASACSPTQLGEYYDKCLSNLGDDNDAGSPCDSWVAANASCASCIAPENNSGPIEWHSGDDYRFYTLNVAGCLALERNELAEGQCPARYSASVQCQRESCTKCLAGENADFDDFQKCQIGAKANACATLEQNFKDACGTTYNDPDGGAFDCFRQTVDGGTEDAKTHFVRVEGIFCGQ